MSVRSRLLALATSLIVCLGGANLLLTRVVMQQDVARERSWQQHRKIEMIQSVVAAMSGYRFRLGQYNSAAVFGDPSQTSAARSAATASLAELEDRLSSIEYFDRESVQGIRFEIGKWPAYLESGVQAFLDGNQADANAQLGKLRSSLDLVDELLATATSREQRRAEEIRQREAAQARWALQASLIIIALSTVTGVVLGSLLLRSVMRPLNATVRAMRQVNEGEISVDLPPISRDEFGEMALALRQFRDHTERLRHLAYTDPLTGLGTRTRLDETLEQAIGRNREHDAPAAVLFMSLDSLRSVNDSFGHRAGDHYLCEAAQRLQRFLPFGTVLCRFGGDKFVAVLEELASDSESALRSNLNGLARNLLGGVSEPFPFRDELLPMPISIGIALCPQDGASVESLITAAETAMYAVRRHGGDGVQFAQPDLRNLARDRLYLVSDLRRGLEHGEFETFYQPIVDVLAHKVIGAEALLRWRHPQRGLLLPGSFVPVAEETGLIRMLGEHCLHDATRQVAQWRREGLDLRVAVNVSARQIEDRTILDQLRRLNNERDHAEENAVDLELTETAMLERIEHAPVILAEIRALGYRISVDDFGTGYSSLSYVQCFPIDKIKIDRSFVARIEHGRESRAIISTTMALARRLDLECVAEGVETPQQMRLLLEMDCPIQQGFLFSRALPATEFLSWARGFEARVQV